MAREINVIGRLEYSRMLRYVEINRDGKLMERVFSTKKEAVEFVAGEVGLHQKITSDNANAFLRDAEGEYGVVFKIKSTGSAGKNANYLLLKKRVNELEKTVIKLMDMMKPEHGA